MGEDNVKRVTIPTDAQVVRDFIAEAEAFRASVEAEGMSTAEAYRREGAADAREALAARLQYVKNQRAELVAEAAEKISAGFAEAGRKISETLKDAFDKANAKADK